MNRELFKGQYVIFAVWWITSMIFVGNAVYIFLPKWAAVLAGAIQLLTLGLLSVGFYRIRSMKNFYICLFALLAEIALTYFALSWFY